MTELSTTRLWMHRLTYASLIILAIGIFTSVSLSAISHILILPPLFYFLITDRSDLKIILSSKTLLGLGAVCLSIILSVIFNFSEMPEPLRNLSKVKYFLLPLLALPAYLAMTREFLTEKKIKALIYLFFIATTLASLSGLIGVWSGFNPLKMKPACHATRACGLYGMYMTYGYGISLFMVLMTGVALLWRKSEKLKSLIPAWLLSITLVINFVGLILSYARGAWLGFALAIPFYFFKEHKKRFALTVLSLAVVGVVSLFAVPKVNQMFFNRADSNSQRLSFFAAAYEGFKEKPLFGWGYRNFEPNVKDIKARHNIAFPEFGSHAHNNYLEHLASTGIIGFLAALFFSLAWIGESYKRFELFFPLALSFFISGQAQYTFGDGENLFLLIPLVILPFIVQRLRSQDH